MLRNNVRDADTISIIKNIFHQNFPFVSYSFLLAAGFSFYPFLKDFCATWVRTFESRSKTHRFSSETKMNREVENPEMDENLNEEDQVKS